MKRLATLVALLLSTAVVTAEEKRQMGAHQHGHGTLEVVADGQSISLELRVPGSDIVGFEHPARSKAQEATIEAAKKVLRAPLELFRPNKDAQCTVSRADVSWEAEHDKGKGHRDHDTHAEFHAAYLLACAAPKKFKTLTFSYFDRFARAKELTVRVLGPNGPRKYRVRRKAPVLGLGPQR